MPRQIPLVDYLKLGEEPRLIAHECTSCGARFFDRRNACAGCGETSFRDVELPAEGTVRTFTVVHRAAPGIPVPFVAALVECGGTSVRCNLAGVEPAAGAVRTGMKVRLTTMPIGTDSAGVEAVGFAFQPAN